MIQKKISNFLLTFLELQLFVSLISWPLLIAWGLPLSWATPIGNLLFGPLLTAFVFLGSLCIFTELLFIPNGLLIYVIERLTGFWLWALSWGHNSFLLYFPQPHILLLLALPACAFAIIIVTNNKYLRLALFSLSFIIFGTAFHLLPENDQLVHLLPYGSKNVLLITCKKSSTLMLPKNIQVKPSLDSWVQYTLIPALAKTTGTATINCLIKTDSSPSTTQWIENIQKQVTCTTTSTTPASQKS